MIGAMGRRWENKTTKIGTVYTSSNLWLQNCTRAQAPSVTRVVFFFVSSVSLDGLRKKQDGS